MGTLTSNGVRICMAVTSDGLTAYCNREALLALARQLELLAASDAEEHYQTHVRMQFEDHEALFNGKTPTNVWVLRAPELAPMLAPHGSFWTFRILKLTFMKVPDKELDELAPYQENGLLPVTWNAQD